MPGADPFATMAMSYAAFRYILVCMGSRVLMGWLSGLLGAALRRVPALQGGRSWAAYGITGFLGSLMNTIFYLGSLWLLCAEVVAAAHEVDLSAVGGIVMATAFTAGIPRRLSPPWWWPPCAGLPSAFLAAVDRGDAASPIGEAAFSCPLPYICEPNIKFPINLWKLGRKWYTTI